MESEFAMSEQKPPITIILTSWNRPKFTKWSLQSIHDNTKYPHQVVVVDNGSEKQMQSELFEMKYNGLIDTLVLLDHNYGLEYAKNLGMTFVTSPLFVSTDNDILAYKYDPDWLERLVALMDTHPEYATIAPRPQILVGTGNIFQGREEDIVEFSHIPGYLRIMRTELVNQLGAWNDKRPLRGHEELWISERLRNMGYKVGWANKIKCWHLFGTDNWGYTADLTPEMHGHNPVSGLPSDDKIAIKEGTGISVMY